MVLVVEEGPLKELLASAATEADLPQDVALINICYLDSPSARRTEYRGIPAAREALEEGKRVILYGFEYPPMMCRKQEFRALLAEFPERVRYVDACALPVVIGGAFERPQLDNPALRVSVQRSSEEELRGRLRHDLKYHRDEVIATARSRLGWQGTDDEVVARLDQPFTKSLAGEQFPGVFCDLEGTLIKDGTRDDALCSRLLEYARTRPVAIWTGNRESKAISALGWIDLPLLDKRDFSGAVVEYAIDDLAREEFEREYGIKALEYERV